MSSRRADRIINYAQNGAVAEEEICDSAFTIYRKTGKMKLTSEKRAQHNKPSWSACTSPTESVITNSVFREFQNLSIDFGCSKWAFGCFLLHLARYFKMFCAIACRYSSVVTFRTPQVRKRVKPRLCFSSPNAPSTCIERFTRSSFPS